MTVEAAIPASPPAISMTSTQERSTFMHATRAALGFLPMVRNSKPGVVRYSSHHTPNAHARASRNPALIRRVEPDGGGWCASPAIEVVLRSDREGPCTTFPRRSESRYAMILARVIVVITASTSG